MREDQRKQLTQYGFPVSVFLNAEEAHEILMQFHSYYSASGRDLKRLPPPHLTTEEIEAIKAKRKEKFEQRTAEAKKILEAAGLPVPSKGYLNPKTARKRAALMTAAKTAKQAQ